MSPCRASSDVAACQAAGIRSDAGRRRFRIGLGNSANRAASPSGGRGSSKCGCNWITPLWFGWFFKFHGPCSDITLIDTIGARYFAKNGLHAAAKHDLAELSGLVSLPTGEVARPGRLKTHATQRRAEARRQIGHSGRQI